MTLNLIMIALYFLISIPPQFKPLRLLLLPLLVVDLIVPYIITSEFWFYLVTGFIWLIPIKRLTDKSCSLALVTLLMPVYYIYLSFETFIYNHNNQYVTMLYTEYTYILATLHLLILVTCIANGVMNGRTNRDSNKLNGNNSFKNKWFSVRNT